MSAASLNGFPDRPFEENGTLPTRIKNVEAKTETSARAERAAPAAAKPKSPSSPAELVAEILQVIDDAKAEDVVTLDLAGKTSIADSMIVASGRSDRHVGAIAERIASSLKDLGQPTPRIEGMPVCDWVLIDAGDIIIHLFRPEVRSFYNLEKLWGMGRPVEGAPPVAEGEKPKRVRKPPVKAASAADSEEPRRAPARKPAARKPATRKSPARRPSA